MNPIAILFPVILWLLGLIVTSALFRTPSLGFFAWTGFLSGGLIWLIGGIIFMIAHIDYTPLSMGLWCGLVIILSLVLHQRRGTWRLSRAEIGQILSVLAGFTVSLVIADVIRFISLSPDSYAHLIMAENLAESRLATAMPTNYGSYQLGLWGVFLPMLHSVAFWFGDSFFLTIQPAFAVSLVGTFGYVCHASIKSDYDQYPILRWLPLVAVLLLAATYMIVYQTFYIHNSIVAAAFLFPAVTLLWWAHLEKDAELIYASMLFFLGFAFARTESLLFTIVFLVPALSYCVFPEKVWWRAFLPYTSVLLVWHLWLLLVIRPYTIILSPPLILILIISLVGLQTLPVLFRLSIIKRVLLPRLGTIMLMTMIVLLSVLIVLLPFHMMPSATFSIRNTLLDGVAWWGLSWYFVLLVPLFLRNVKSLRYPAILTMSLFGFFLLVWLMGLPRMPYRLGIGDSANRMFTHVLPIALFYVHMRVAYALREHADREISQAETPTMAG